MTSILDAAAAGRTHGPILVRPLRGAGGKPRHRLVHGIDPPDDRAATRAVNLDEEKTHLSRLLEAVERSEEVVIARAGHPVARLVPAAPTPER